MLKGCAECFRPKPEADIKSCECECLYYKDCVTSSSGVSVGIHFWVFYKQTQQ